MAARDETAGPGRGVGNTARRQTTETKASFKTSELVAYVVVFIGILIAANVIEDEGGNDFFTADKAWLYITILTFGYMVSRGLAKSGSREPYTDDGDHDRR
jgi:hypothetical protein